MTKIAIYCRVSSQRQEQEKTIKSQLADLREACKDYDIIDEYIDDGWSGELLARPELDRLRDDISKGLFEKVLIHSPDRLARKYAYQVLILEELKKKDIEVEFLNHKTDDTPEGNLLLQIQGAVAEFEKVKMMERLRRGKMYQAKSGRIIGNVAPYGYSYKKGQPREKRKYKINLIEAETVKKVFELYIRHQSINAVSREITKIGTYQTRSNKTLWRASIIHSMLRNETYIGTTYYNRRKSIEIDNGNKYTRRIKSGIEFRPKDEWIAISTPSIIDKKTFNLVQRILKKNKRPYFGGKSRYMLSGLVKCICGLSYNGSYYKDYDRRYYVCTNSKKIFPNPRMCFAKGIKSEILEEIVWSSIYKAITRPRLMMAYAGFEAKKRDNGQRLLKEINDLDKRIQKENKKKDRLIEIYQEGDIDKKEYKIKIKDINNVKDNLIKEKTERQEILNQANNIPINKKIIENFCELAKKKIENLSFEQKGRLLGILLEKVIYDSSKKTVKIIGQIPKNLSKSDCYISRCVLSTSSI